MPFCRSVSSSWSSSSFFLRSLLPHHIPRRMVCGRGWPRPKTGFSFCWLYHGFNRKYSFSTSTSCCCFFSSLWVSLVPAVWFVLLRSMIDGILLLQLDVCCRLYGVSSPDVRIFAMLVPVSAPRSG